eukprot:scaffold34615_cov26-Tisochrysis_lutea.AAC.1
MHLLEFGVRDDRDVAYSCFYLAECGVVGKRALDRDRGAGRFGLRARHEDGFGWCRIEAASAQGLGAAGLGL